MVIHAFFPKYLNFRLKSPMHEQNYFSIMIGKEGPFKPLDQIYKIIKVDDCTELQNKQITANFMCY